MSRVEDLRTVNAVAEALNSAPDVEQALTCTLGLVAERLGLQTGWVWLVDRETGQMYHAASRNLPPYLQQPVRMIGDTCTCISEFRDGVLTPKNVDVLECSRLRRAAKERAEAQTQGLKYHATIPLTFQDQALGIMNLTGPARRELNAAELRLLSTIAYQVGIAVERARLAEERAHLARAEERTRMAREIHDTLAQDLTAIALHVEGALHLLEANPATARERLERALETARDSLEETRRSVLHLRTPTLAGRSLPQALAAVARSFTSETGVRVHVHVQGRGSLPLRAEAELFRIAQEALTNVRRHAGATEVHIRLSANPRRATLSIADNGRGFRHRAAAEPSTAAEAARHGLVGMRERAALLGGTLRLASRPGAGTTVTASVPLVPAGSAAAMPLSQASGSHS